jgi:hypothetical protein
MKGFVDGVGDAAPDRGIGLELFELDHATRFAAVVWSFHSVLGH